MTSEASSPTVHTDVLIVGAGPCGDTIANLLGAYGLRAVIVDRATEVVDYPRGVGVDDESLRAFQSAGVANEVHADMIQNQALIWHDSKLRPIAQAAPSGQPFGWPRRNSFLQPLLEKRLRTGLQRFDNIELRTGVTLVDFTQHDDHVLSRLVDQDGAEQAVHSRYIVGADGGRSTVRKIAGITLEGSTLAHRWLVVDIMDSTYHAPFSGNYISSSRPFVSIDLPFGYRRFEFRLREDERDEDMVKPEAVERLIRTHFDWKDDLPGLERARVYSHHSRVADHFRAGRAFVAGDAAHLQPPWFGQGMNSGIRDAANLAWKLAAAIRIGETAALLDSYEDERRGHARALVELATMLGRIYSPKSKAGEIVRSYGFRAIQKLPGVRDYFLQMRFKPMPYYDRGIVLDPSNKGVVGRMVIQPDVETADGQRMKLDEALGDWFAVVGINIDPYEAMDEEARRYWHTIGARFLRINRSRAGSHLHASSGPTVVLDDLEGRFRDWSAGHSNREIVVIRPDRYVGAISHRSDASTMTRRFAKLLPTRLSTASAAQ